MTIPNVFVVPPEEDHSPAWCYFDAAQRQLEHFNSTLIVVDSDDQVECDVHCNFEQDVQLGFQQSSMYRDMTNDSDVIEVVKVGRCPLDNESTIHAEQYPADFTRSKTLKSRASRMFHSLKKVGKRKRVPNRSIPDGVTSSSIPSYHPLRNSTEATTYRERGTDFSETLPRRKSVAFSVSTGLRSHSSSLHFQDTMGPYPPRSESNPGYYTDTNSASPPRSPSPSPSFMAKRRLSKINLQKMFSFSTTTSPLENITRPTFSSDLARSSTENTDLLQSSSVASRSDRMPSLDSNVVNYLDNVACSPTISGDKFPRQSLSKGIDSEDTMLVEHPSLAAELSFNLGTDLDLNLEVPNKVTHTPQVGIPPTKSTTDMLEDETSIAFLGDISFEMRLDSLHFDDLSFDVNKF